MIRARISSSVALFALLVVLVIFSHKLLANKVIGEGLTNEDYVGFQFVRVYKDEIFSNPIGFWYRDSLHNVAHDFYIGLLDLLFKENYDMYLYSSIFLKILATLSLFPLVLLITKNKFLAFLATFLFGISYPSAGALRLYVVGNEYLGIALMNLFLVIYVYCVRKISLRLLMLSSLVVTLSFLAAPIRVFPVFAIVLLVEAFVLIRSKFSNFLPVLMRILAIFLPSVIIVLLSLEVTGSGSYGTAGIPDFLRKVGEGNWWLMLVPFWGFGYTFLPIRYMVQTFGLLDVNHYNLQTYLLFLFKPFVIFLVSSWVLSVFISKQKFRFFLILVSINTVLDVLLFIIFSRHFSIDPKLVVGGGFSSFSGLYASLLANYIISVAISCLIEWYLTGRNNILLLATAISPFLSLMFVISQWIFTRDYNIYAEGMHRYFVLPAIGSYLFLACLIVLIYQKAIKKRGIFVSFSYLLMGLIILSIISVSNSETSMIFDGRKTQGHDLRIQESMKNQALSYIPRDKVQEDLLIYVKFKSDKLEDANSWEDIFDWRDIIMWMGLKRSYLANNRMEGCIAMTWDMDELQKMFTIQNGTRGFLYEDPQGHKDGFCATPGQSSSMNGKFLPLENLYVFAIDQTRVIDLSQEIRKEFE